MTYLLFNNINWTNVLIIAGIATLLSLIFVLLILVVSKLCAVKEDEKAKEILSHLAGANCGGCGFPGCDGFSKALSEGKADITACGPTSNEGKKAICEILGKPFVEQEEVFAVVHCAGGIQSKEKYSYVGNQGCTNEHVYFGGKKVCPSGCVGDGSCIEACFNNAIKIKDGVALVNRSLCGACKVCEKICPKGIIQLIPKSASVYIACSSVCKGKAVMEACKTGCIGCGICAKNCPEGAITMIDNLPIIDYSKCNGCKTCVAKCPRKTICEI